MPTSPFFNGKYVLLNVFYQCKKQHVLECPEFSKNSSCPRGKTCPLRHRKKRQRSSTSIFNQKGSTTTIDKVCRL